MRIAINSRRGQAARRFAALAWLALPVLFGTLWAASCLAQGPSTGMAVRLHAGTDRADLRGALTYFGDQAGALDLAAARRAEAQGAFEPVRALPATFGFADGTYWFHWRVDNVDHREDRWVVAVAYALLDDVELYVVHDDGSSRSHASGDSRPFATRALDHRHLTFPLQLAAGRSADLFLRVRSQSSIQVPIELMTVEAFLARAPLEHLGLGIYYGILIGLFCYNLILYLATRDRTFLYYVLYAGFFALGQLSLNGIAFQHFWPAAPAWANEAVLVFIALGLASMLQFTRSFLDLGRTWPAVDRVMRGFMVVLLAAIAASALLGYRRTILVETALVFVIAALIMIAAVRVWRDGFRPASNFVLAWSVMLVGVVVYAAVSFGLLPKLFITEYGIQIGSAAEMILLSFALADRINSLREENARIQREAREQLETRVAERTVELNQALDKLESANQTLREFSMHDGLTGAYNRRYFDQYLPQVWAQARGERQPLSLVMVDLDHFKEINDRHGHQVGDDCLRSVAQCLRQQLRGDHERVVRYGGEEFFVVMPGVEADAAGWRAERIRLAISDLHVRTDGLELRLTISVGLATFHPDAALTPSDLLRVTDRALYEAKRAGRNRVVTGDAPGNRGS
jgi:diguanylate cyclase (GGDEF)-like protein